ncbi:MAG: TlyA family RNA methyltransferase [Candidatus Lernaella stagnicola]|nr:TlyA family RNA methyltransferase [Candidatus Lernaella stagnicola]
MAGKKPRLDHLVFERGLAESREKAKALIMAGKVLVNDRPAEKPGTPTNPTADIRLRGTLPYVSRGGEKLVGALDALGVDPTGGDWLDVGQSTGGFTDVLLQRGAAHVTGIDVGYGQLANKLRQDPRVSCMERTNARTLPPDFFQGRRFDGAVIDVSFISLRSVLPAVAPHLRIGASTLAMVKPQFEAGRERLGKGGVVRDPEVIAECVAQIAAFGGELGLAARGEAPAPIQGPKGNQEVFVLFEKISDA